MFVERVEEISYREPVIWPHGAIQRCQDDGKMGFLAGAKLDSIGFAGIAFLSMV